LWVFTVKSLKEGIPSSLTYGDLSICMLIMKLQLTKTNNIDLIDSSAFFASIFGICCQCVELGVTEAFGMQASKAAGREDWAYVQQKFKQSMIVHAFLLIIFMVLPSFFIGDFMTWAADLLNCNEEMIEFTKMMVIYTIPACFVRIFNGNLKTLFQSLEFFHSAIAYIALLGGIVFFFTFKTLS
jgi:Na+-driven multidrug efflux pump